MWATEAKHKTKAKKEQIWKLWTDVRNWNMWDDSVEFSELFGEFKAGSKGILKSKGGPKTKFTITECSKFKSFTNTSVLPFCKMDFVHTITETKDGIEIIHKVVMTGFMTFLFSKIIGGKLKSGLPGVVKKLVKTAENNNI